MKRTLERELKSACKTCSVGSEATISTFAEIISYSDSEQVLSAMGEAFAEGAKGANAVAQAMVDSVAAGHSKAVTSAIAEAFGAQEISGTAIVQAITEAINMGGDEMTIAVADAFALAEAGGYVDALAQAIADAWSVSDDAKAKAMTSAIAAAIANGNCEAMSVALGEASALAAGQGSGDAFAASMAESEAISDCFYSSDEPVAGAYSYGDSYVFADSESAKTVSTEDIVGYLMVNDVSAAVTAISKALDDGRTTALSDAVAKAIGDGADSKTLVDAIVKVIKEYGQTAINAVVEALAATEIGYSDAVAKLFLEGILGSEGVYAEYIAAIITEGVAKYECSVFAQSLPLAYATAVDTGYGSAFVDALSSVAKSCLKIDFSLADSVKDALLKGDMTAVSELTIQAAGEAEGTAAFVEGLSVAKQMNVDCATIKQALSLAKDLYDLRAEVSKADSVAKCLSSGYSQCRGSVARSCCVDGYPTECACSRMRCRANKNMDVSLPELGLHVYTDVGSRNCECPVVA
eukprot:TRINITY_DN2224_c0_g2_i1.p1 TRINITY_DN2224_c0_g2~~TRINITY_DN2224_c0_g2_i1.p1  ORF type:complete len:535 (-),score=162.11 TRINITY_DN2224_c0_g2_i1:354-1916(-)